MAYSTANCDQGITDETLSAWRDGILSTDQSQSLAAHVSTCRVCQLRSDGFVLAQRALRAQRTPDLQDQIWRGLRAPLRPRRHISVAARWAAPLGILAVVMLVIVATRLGAGIHSTRVLPTQTASLVATATALSTTPSPSGHVTPEQAWGVAGIHTIPIGQDNFAVSDVLPDASGVVGVINPKNATGLPTVGYYSFAQKTLLAIHAMPTADDYPNVMTDGRYIVWVGQMNNTGGAGSHAQEVGYADLTATPISAHITYQASVQLYDPHAMAVDHGTLFLGKGLANESLVAIDLATGNERTLLATYAAVDGIRFSVSWPHVLYADDTGAMHLLNVTSGSLRALPQVVIAPQGDAPFLSPKISGSTVIWSQPGSGGSVFYQVDNADQPGAIARQIFTFPGDIPTFYAAVNPRLIVWATSVSGVAWDLAQQRAVYLPSISQGTLFPSVILHGHACGYITGDGQGASFIVRDTGTLPAISPTS